MTRGCPQSPSAHNETQIFAGITARMLSLESREAFVAAPDEEGDPIALLILLRWDRKSRGSTEFLLLTEDVDLMLVSMEDL